MNDDRLGMAAGAWLRTRDRPATDPRHSIAYVMRQVRETPQDTGATLVPLQLTPITNGRTPWPVEAQSGGSRKMLTPVLLVAGVSAIMAGAFLFAGVLAPSVSDVPGAESPGAPASAEPRGVHWSTERAILSAEGLSLDVNGLTFGSDLWPQNVRSGPGSSKRWTFEVDWLEHGVGQRLQMYFRSDGTDWWVDQIRTYDGYPQGEWVFAYGPFFQTPLGEAFEGNVIVELVGEGRPEDPGNRVPAMLGFDGLRLEVSPRTEDDRIVEPTGEGDEEPTGNVTSDPAEEQCGSDGEFPTEEAETVCRALVVAFGNPHEGDACRSVEDARQVAEAVLTDLGLTGWSIAPREPLRDDGCAIAYVDDQDQITITTGMHPDVKAVLNEFLDHSLDECLDEDTAVGMLTERLDAIGHQDFVVTVDDTLGGPSDRWEEIQAHADAGCVFYVMSGAERDGTAVYKLHGG